MCSETVLANITTRSGFSMENQMQKVNFWPVSSLKKNFRASRSFACTLRSKIFFRLDLTSKLNFHVMRGLEF